MKKEVSTLPELYIEILEKIEEYCQATREQSALQLLPRQEHLERTKQIITHQVKETLSKIKSRLSQEEEKEPYKLPVGTAEKKEGLKDIFKWLNPSYSYLVFLKNLKKNNEQMFVSQYEEIEVKRRALKYFRQFTQYRRAVRINSKINSKICRYPELSNRSYCIQCRRVIMNKMAVRHSHSKAHAGNKPVYLRATEAQAMQINTQFAQVVRRNKMHLRNLIQRETKTKIKRISLEPYPEKTEEEKKKDSKKSIKYTCEICDRSYAKKELFMMHFGQRDHKTKLRLLGVKNPQDYSGLTTEEAVRTRHKLYFIQDN